MERQEYEIIKYRHVDRHMPVNFITFLLYPLDPSNSDPGQRRVIVYGLSSEHELSHELMDYGAAKLGQLPHDIEPTCGGVLRGNFSLYRTSGDYDEEYLPDDAIEALRQHLIDTSNGSNT